MYLSGRIKNKRESTCNPPSAFRAPPILRKKVAGSYRSISSRIKRVALFMWICLVVVAFFLQKRLDYPICLNNAFLLRSKLFLTSPTPAAKAKGKEENYPPPLMPCTFKSASEPVYIRSTGSGKLLCALWVERSEGSLGKLCASSRHGKLAAPTPPEKKARFTQVPSKTAECFSFFLPLSDESFAAREPLRAQHQILSRKPYHLLENDLRPRSA